MQEYNKIMTILICTIFLSVSVLLSETKTAYSLPADDVIPLIDEDYYPAVHKAFSNAKKSILCVMYMAKLDRRHKDGDEYQLVLDLINAHKRGVEVLVIFDQNVKFWEKGKKRDRIERRSEYAYDLLLRAGVPVFYDNKNRVTHSKVMVIDTYITIVGSTNWTYGALRKNHEASVMITSRDVALVFERKLKHIEKNIAK
ncbi:phosphatidylserine/phosphatidylglycerophosphate /cardiolipin synthases and related enzymes [Candidatus Scalindua japonica]|uniref:phospholipase D n=1 Tax=Candidatus Scalindua japonica TaxID=1284222 RepID=A0A286TYU7_9BACT|nr:phospholipase D-like domain-containing protein [Candidatus Scalindua japonica]GAX61062.1 phosphatidylserine/phosphatidylglycerophosphate /cardiolipin synthases and related enzymes [Candidatus Scalindua japonica]